MPTPLHPFALPDINNPSPTEMDALCDQIEEHGIAPGNRAFTSWLVSLFEAYSDAQSEAEEATHSLRDAIASAIALLEETL